MRPKPVYDICHLWANGRKAAKTPNKDCLNRIAAAFHVSFQAAFRNEGFSKWISNTSYGLMWVWNTRRKRPVNPSFPIPFLV